MTKLLDIISWVLVGLILGDTLRQFGSEDKKGYGNCGDQHCEGCSGCDCDDDEGEFELSEKEMDIIAAKVAVKMSELDRQCK